MTRTGKPSELLYGPLFFTLIMNTVGLLCFQDREVGILIMASLGYGDGIAPLVGGYMPFGQYPTYPFGRGDKKTLSGSLGFFVSSIVGYSVFKGMLMDTESSSDLGRVLRVIAVTTITEGITGSFDNIFIALSAYLSYKYL
eukprot:CAMPEP_0194151252 /NCGR_PEP_ID=MMETSP0152-20130528/47339_1 /TAXON_ID=1049557 /ORGANISM="Thalassiothrix antarctica, Strain L6-D1" /LENGTH=140 /DNA_ID=CAMNT_0038854905 /DNA_START=194 /DNA_END=616 /DNA_ORIENTATION=-